MNLTEHSSKKLLARAGIPVPEGRLAKNAQDALLACQAIGASKYAVKAQIKAGGRGLAGGITFAETPSEVQTSTSAMLDQPLVTNQTAREGEIVTTVLIEEAMDLERSWYLALLLDSHSGQPMLVASKQGGVEFEQRARMGDADIRSLLLPGDGDPDRRELESFLGALDMEIEAVAPIVHSALSAFIKEDMTLIELNPFSQTRAGNWMAIDAKVALDPSAAFRHPEREAFDEAAAPEGPEQEAQKSNINFVKLDGNLGVVVNGAGLGLATNDMIIDAGGRPANFMDIRTTATSLDIARGVDLLLKDRSVRAILINVHGGGMTVCDTIAEGVSIAYAKSERKTPCIARLAGVNAEWGNRILSERGVPVELFEEPVSAVERALTVAGR
ncbi:MAG: ATP-grasp domain-containing protein [Pseudomonadota bacterium]